MNYKEQFKNKINKEIKLEEIFDKKILKNPTVLIAAGHGYGNVGDEAQLASVLLKYKKFTSVKDFILLSPNPLLSQKIHTGYSFEWSSRVSIFNCNLSNKFNQLKRYSFKNILRLCWYLFRFRITAFCINKKIPLLFLKGSEALIFNQIIRANLLHISGGGFITGATRSRLIDSFFLMKLSKWLKVPYILTGHSISNLNKVDSFLLKNALKNAEFITLRDGGFSQKILENIGLDKSIFTSTSDEALLLNYLNPIKKKIKKNKFEDYVVFHYHDWNISKDKEKKIFKRFKEIKKFLNDHLFDIKLISMTPSDVDCLLRLSKALDIDKSQNIKYSTDYSVNMQVISSSRFVLTMKHHPIIFAQANSIPVLALSFHEYSYQKNKGALKNTGSEDCNFDYEAFMSVNNLESKIIDIMKKEKEYKKSCLKYIENQINLEKNNYSKKISDILFF